MSWSGTIRSIEAAARRIERERQRQLRIAQRVALHHQKMAELEQAQFEVEEFEEQMARLSGPHRDCGETIDWESLLQGPPPDAPERRALHEQRARAVASAYRPSIWDRLLGRVQKKR